MNTKINRYLIGLSLIISPLAFGMMATSCESMLETESDLVEFAEDHTLNHATDSVYSVMGIVSSMQRIADRVVLLGEVRSDLVQTTPAANTDLKRLADFDLKEDNRYNQVSDYYALINNCNYYLAHIDTAMNRRGRNLFIREYAVVKSYRAWAYLQLVQAYGEVPLVLQPLMSEREASAAMEQPRAGIREVCETFIDDLTPYVGVQLPNYGTVNGMQVGRFFIPMKALLGDLCLWAGRYREAARWYHDFLTEKEEPVHMSRYRISWTSATQFTYPNDGYSPLSELITYIPMETRIFDGTVSQLPNLFKSTTENNFYYQLTPSPAISQISQDQIYCLEHTVIFSNGKTGKDTVYVPRAGFSENNLVGDLRLYSNVRIHSSGTQDEYSEYSMTTQTMWKVLEGYIPLYRSSMVYLRYAEALNRAGLPQSAFAILKYGICDQVLREHVDTLELQRGGDLLTFDPDVFRLYNDEGQLIIRGVHALGSGDAHANKYYTLPQPTAPLATRQDTIDYQIPLVEDMIITEMALEGAFEGYRFYDLMRVALRRSDPAYLATPVSRRKNSEGDPQLYQLLMDTRNWYLPLR